MINAKLTFQRSQPPYKSRLCNVLAQFVCFLIIPIASLVSAQPTHATGLKEAVYLKKSCSSEIGDEPPTTNTELQKGECGTLEVLEDPDNPSGRSIILNIVRLPAHSGVTRSPVFFIAGGPGQASTRLAKRFQYVFARLREHRDLVFVDQRGSGHSKPLNCNNSAPEHSQRSPQETLERGIESHRQCVADYDADLSRYTTPYAIHDLEQVRKAMGYTSINVWGGSYGTRVILAYLREHPESIDAAILDGAAPVSMGIPHYTDDDASQALATVFSLCQRSPACAQAFPNLQTRWLSLLDKLKLEPISIPLQHPRTQEQVLVYLDDTVLSGWVRTALYSREASALLPLAIDSATKQDFAQLFSLLAVSTDTHSGEKVQMISEGLYMSIICTEDGNLVNTAPTTSANTSSTKYAIDAEGAKLIRTHGVTHHQRLCTLYPKSGPDPEYYEPVNTAVPSLILSGELDPVTPPRWADSASAGFSNVRHIRVKGGHHGVSGLGCMPRLIVKFFEQQQLSDDDVSCVDAIQPAAFFVDNAGPALAVTPRQMPPEESTQGELTKKSTPAKEQTSAND